MCKDILLLDKVSLSIDGNNILNDISFKLKQHDFTVVVGANGSGKSSLFKLISRYHTPSMGSVNLLGVNANDYAAKDYANKVILLSQTVNDHLCLSMTIAEHVRLYAMATDKNYKDERSIIAYLISFNEKFAEFYHVPVINLSGGEKQLLALALCLMRKPKLLLLDEHTSALDPNASTKVMEITDQKIKEHGVSCLMVTHDPKLALKYGNQLIIMQSGRIGQWCNSQSKSQLTSQSLVETCYY